ncbi:MAG: Serine/threonine-protein kinase TAO1, partial [Marteilia pararefringens]
MSLFSWPLRTMPIHGKNSMYMCLINIILAKGKLNIQDNGIILKCVNFDDFGKKRYKRLQTELEIIRMCQHPNFVEFYDCFYETDKHLAIMMMELCIGSIESLCCVFYGIKDWTLFTEIFLYTAAKILIFLDSLGIIHRDLKPANFLFSSELSIKLCDFGTCRIAKSSKTYVGTPYYMAPEVALNLEKDVKEYSSKIDIWSAGATAMAILMQKSLWGEGDTKKKISDRLKTEDPPLLKKVRNFAPKTSHGADTAGKKRLMQLKVAIGRMVVRNPENRWNAKRFKQFVSGWCISEQGIHDYFTKLINELGQATCESYDP